MLLGVALVMSVVLQLFVARVFVIPSESMEPTLLGCDRCGITNDRIVVDRLTYRFTDPAAGDVVVFEGPVAWQRTPGADEDFVKRVVATAGQTGQCCDSAGRVQVDGAARTEPHVASDFPFTAGVQDCMTPVVSARCFGPVTVPAGSLWLMGDNRDHSADSRVHGPVAVSDVIGKARVVVVPVSRWQVID